MPSWDELFGRGELIAAYPERPVQEFVSLLERRFRDRPLRIWDLCCGAGRHTTAMSRRGHAVFASDASANGIALLEEGLAKLGLTAQTAVADMTVCPWPGVRFHGVVVWDALHHNRLLGVRTSIGVAFERLVPGGWLLATLKSVQADSSGVGDEIEPGTFVQRTGAEAGVPHHYFTETEIRDVFQAWHLDVLVERVCSYKQRISDFRDNPFDYTAWGILARKPGETRPQSN